MSNANHIGNRPRWPGTLAISAGALVLGIPLAIAALRLAQTDVSDITLGQKEIKAGPNGETKTITFGLLTGVTDAIVAGSYISIISSLVFVVGLVVLRHFSQHNILGWMLVFPALVNLFGNVGCMGYAFVQNGKEKMASSAEEVPRNPTTGTYDTGGKLYTREAWACMMDRFYHDQEGEWAESACSGLKTARSLTIGLVITAVLLLGLALWQVQRRGGFAWLMGRRKTLAAMSRSKAEYIDLQGRA